jgi:hypothetical protein
LNYTRFVLLEKTPDVLTIRELESGAETMKNRYFHRRTSQTTRFTIGVAVVAIGSLISQNSAHAVVIVPAPSGTTTVTPTNLPGGLPAGLPAGDVYIPGALETEPFTGYNAQGQIVFEGTVTSMVYADPSEPSFAGNPAGLDFVYQLTNNTDGMTPDDPIDRLSLSSFASFQTDVDYLGGTGNVAPTTADRSSIPGSIVGFNFPVGAMVGIGQNTDYLVVETDASTYVQGTASVIDGGTGSTHSDAPVAATVLTVPEPATFGLLAVVGGMLLGRRRR